MNSKRQQAWMIGLGLAGLLGLVIAASAQVGGTAVQQYEQKLKSLDRSKVDDIYALAKWCFQNTLTKEAQDLALEANQKAPDDLRPKYLLYALTGGGETTAVSVTEEAKLPEPTISDAEIAAIYKTEGNAAMNGFRQVQQAMLNACGSLKCHGGGNPASKWVLIRRNVTEKKTLAENFRTVNRYITRGDDWADSTLLQKPLKGPDAGHPQIVFRGGTNDPVYTNVSKWIKPLKTATSIIWGKTGK
jgi:hypothetical protein